jgi:hypothetical protein
LRFQLQNFAAQRLSRAVERSEIESQYFTRTMTMFDAYIALALFAAFLLGMVAGSGLEVIVRGVRR